MQNLEPWRLALKAHLEAVKGRGSIFIIYERDLDPFLEVQNVKFYTNFKSSAIFAFLTLMLCIPYTNVVDPLSFLSIRILGSVIPNFGSGSRRPINYGSGSTTLLLTLKVKICKNMSLQQEILM